MVNNPLDALFRRLDDTKNARNDGGGAKNDPSDDGGAALPDLKQLWNKVDAKKWIGGGGDVENGMRVTKANSEHLTKAQQEELEVLLARYSIGTPGHVAPEALEEGGVEDETNECANTGKVQNEKGTESDEDGGCCGCCSSLTYWERLLGCLVFIVGGYVLEMGSLRRIMWLIEGDPLPFVALWTLGHVVSICGSMFLVGPKQQCRNMFIPVRAPATTAYLACLGITLAIVVGCVILDRPTGLALSIVLVMLLFVQCLCILWYTASCVPFLREYLARKMFGDKLLPSIGNNTADQSKANGASGGGLFGWFRRKRRNYEEIPS
eukprot:CAMPEP_0197443308 /NCGR_PEP_ID=MMETSP1175-20131217/9070_1 /TAXON_ID=1003142 /ORGANISM="Triceratium dubium, Strain CCMP147" /LENGTH=321 /DNA_ID=CAMNT_0042973919 /DNA_START=384 /DNA_END=1349 /DNA_ORIENTATION=+